MPRYQVAITTVDPTGRPTAFRRRVRAGRPEDAVDIACARLGLRREVDRPVAPVGFWMSQARGAHALSPRSRRSGTVAADGPPSPASKVLARA